MPGALSITGDLGIPAALLIGRTMPDVEVVLQRAGLLPSHAEQRRWRMDPEAPGAYRLTFTVTLREEALRGGGTGP
jgi:hypothetical protein